MPLRGIKNPNPYNLERVLDKALREVHSRMKEYLVWAT